jgi:hypothetical protein
MVGGLGAFVCLRAALLAKRLRLSVVIANPLEVEIREFDRRYSFAQVTRWQHSVVSVVASHASRLVQIAESFGINSEDQVGFRERLSQRRSRERLSLAFSAFHSTSPSNCSAIRPSRTY